MNSSKRYLLNILWVCGLLLCFCGWSNAQTMQRSELLGRPTNNSMTVRLLFVDSVQVRVQYGTSAGNYTNQTTWQTFAPNVPAEILMSGLQANTSYYYRVNYRQPNAAGFNSRPEYTFHTQRSIGSGYTFIVQADPHMDEQSDTNLYKLCLQNQLDDNPDFMIDLGDFLMTDKLKNLATNTIPYDTIPYRCNLLSAYYERITHSVPLYIALGNHEGESGWNLNGTANNIAVWGTLERKKYFLNPAPSTFYSGDTTQHPYIGNRENYYAWNWGDALFIVIDPYWYTSTKPDSLHGWRWTLGQTQYNWLKSTLENSTARFKFVFSHQLVGGDPDGRGGTELANRYEWGGDNLDGTPGFAANRPGWYKPIKDLLTEHRVTIFFHGHDHLFDKQEKDCLIYQESPQPSHPNFSNVNYAASYGYVSGLIIPQSGHLRVKVDSNGVQVDYVRAYLPANENTTRHNKDVAATYYVGAINCYDSIASHIPVLWNEQYSNELVYPNPFTESTTLSFTLKNADKLSLVIYNEYGQVIRQLLRNSQVPAGSFQVAWDGKNDTGAQVANGLYWYKIQGTTFSNNTGKIILMH